MADPARGALADAKAAIQTRDWTTAQRVLAPVVAENPHSVATFQLARVQLELGRPKEAAVLIAAFRAWRPQHTGARLLAGRIHLANGELDEADVEARAALGVEGHDAAAQTLLASIAVAREARAAQFLIDVINRQYVRARTSGPTREALDAAAALHRLVPGPRWASDPTQATIAYFHFAADLPWALRNYDPHLIAMSTRFDYISWPRRIQEYVRGRRVLDVGCGFGGFGMGYLVAGTTAYTGIDPAMELDSSRAKDKRLRRWADMGVTPRQIMRDLPGIRLIQGSSEDTEADEAFDTITLHNVTEHLMKLDDVLQGLVSWCTPESHLVIHHHNFYCWNGHHLPPNQPQQLDLDDPQHQLVYDWRHIEAAAALPPDHYIRTSLNRVRLDELHDVLSRYFTVVRWDEIASSQATLERLTPEIVARLRTVIPDLTERELTTNAVFAVARVKQ